MYGETNLTVARQRRAAPRTERCAPRRRQPLIDIAEPQRLKLRMESEEPMLRRSTTDMLMPMRVMARTLRPE